MKEQKFKDNLKVDSTSSIVEIQNELATTLSDLLDTYEQNNAFKTREFLVYLTSAIFLVYKEKYPQISTYLLFRTKSDLSFTQNLQKEYINSLSNPNKPLSSLSPNAIKKDISGIRLVLDSIKESNISKSINSLESLDSSPEISKLFAEVKENYRFKDKIQEYISSTTHGSKEYYTLMLELLRRIKDITPEEFTKENEPEPSYAKLYEQMQETISYYENDSENSYPQITDEKLQRLKFLVSEYSSRIENQLHFSVLHYTLPIVLNDPLIKNALQTTFTIDPSKVKNNGDVRKTNAFQAIYYLLYTPFGQIELQSQSSRAYYVAQKGSAYHSGISGKSVDVSKFFELVDPNDEKPLDYYLDKLDSISADTLIYESMFPSFKNEDEKNKFLKSEQGKKYKQTMEILELKKHIKIKDTIELLPAYLPDSVYTDKTKKSIDPDKLYKFLHSANPPQKLISMNANLYLLSQALSVSPYMNVVSSGHSSFTTASNHNKKIVGEFAEALRKKDSNTCLRDILIDRLTDILQNPNTYFPDVKIRPLSTLNINSSNPEHRPNYIEQCLIIAQRHEKFASKLPKDIAIKDIAKYGEKLKKSVPSYEKNS